MLEEDRTGQTVGGTYRIERQLGRGAFGIVWLSRRVSDGKPVVLKVLHQQWARVPTVVERFRREGQVAGKINHPNVAQVYGYSATDDGVPFIAMEYLPGGTLKAYLKEHGALDAARAAELWAPVCDAVSVAHMMGIVHRDLKPENVMLTTRGTNTTFPVVLDFGIAKFLDSAEKLTSTGTMMGTPTYMAPEQCRGQVDLGPPADVYSLGAISFELIAGKPPFVGKTVAELAMKHLLDPPPPLTQAPPLLAQMVARCLEKEAEKRPPASALAEALRKAARSATGSSAAVSSPMATTLAGAKSNSAAATVVGAESPLAGLQLRDGRTSAASTVVSGRSPQGLGRPPSGAFKHQGEVPASSEASTVMVGNEEGRAMLDRERARRNQAGARGSRGAGPPVVVVIAVAVALAAVGGLIAVLLLH